MSAPRSSLVALPWDSADSVRAFFVASRTESTGSLKELPRIDNVEVAVCLVTKRRIGGVSALSFFASRDSQDRFDVTVRTSALSTAFDPREAARIALAKTTDIHMNPKPLRPYVRVDYSGNYGTALVYPYVLAVSSCAPDKFNAKLTPFDIDELAARANASRLADSGQRFYPTIVYDATEATKAAI